MQDLKFITDVIMLVLGKWEAFLGVVALITILVNVLKWAGVVKDGTASVWSMVLNGIGMVTFIVVKIVKPDTDLMILDTNMSLIAQVLSLLFTYVLQLGGSKLVHFILKGLPVIGKSFSKSV
jgi:hypothetical protein